MFKRAKKRGGIVLITSTITPYVYDVARLLNLAPAGEYRFRYAENWIDPQLRSVEDLAGEALVVLRVVDSAEFIPIRKCKIVKTTKFGDSYYLELKVGDFILETDAARFVSEIANFHQKNNQPDVQLIPLVHRLDDLNTLSANRDSSVDWHKIVTRLGSHASFKDYAFFRLLSIESIDNKKKLYSAMLGDPLPTVSAGRRYELHLYQEIPSELKKSETISQPFRVKLSSLEPGVVILQGTQEIVGKYDILRFAFAIPSLSWRRRVVVLEFRTEGGQAMDSVMPFLRISIPVTSSFGSRVWGLVRWLAAGLSLVLTFFAESLGRFLDLEPETLRGIAFIGLLVASGKLEGGIDKLQDRDKDVSI